MYKYFMNIVTVPVKYLRRGEVLAGGVQVGRVNQGWFNIVLIDTSGENVWTPRHERLMPFFVRIMAHMIHKF